METLMGIALVVHLVMWMADWLVERKVFEME
jgi:hypothetical protein